MDFHFTPASERALVAAARWARQACAEGLGTPELDVPELLLGLISEPECRAAQMLAAGGIDQAAVQDRWPELSLLAADASVRRENFAPALRSSLVAATARLFDYPRPLALATEHLLLGIVAAEHETSAWLIDRGFDPVSDVSERGSALLRQRLMGVMREDEHRDVEGRIVAPPAVRVRIVLPRALATAEHSPAHDHGTRVGDRLGDDLAVRVPLTPGEPMGLAPARELDDPLVEPLATPPERLLETRIGPGDEAVE